MCEALKTLMKDEIAEERNKGRAEERVSLAREMLLDGKSDAEILKYSKLSGKELNHLKKEVAN